MLCKVFLCSLLVAHAFVGCAANETGCTLTNVTNGLVEEECGNRLVLKYPNGTAKYDERLLFDNEILSVLELNDDRSSCFVLLKSDFPEGVDYPQNEKYEVVANASPCESTAVQNFVPECRGRIIYNLKSETEDNATGIRKKRGICYKLVECIRFCFVSSGRLTCRYFCRWIVYRC